MVFCDSVSLFETSRCGIGFITLIPLNKPMKSQTSISVNRRAESSPDSVRIFWQRFEWLLEQRGIQSRERPWYVRDAQEFVRHFKDIPLKQRSMREVDTFLEHLERGKGRNPGRWSKRAKPLRFCMAIFYEWICRG